MQNWTIQKNIMLQFKKDAILAIKIKYDSWDPSLQLSWTDLGIIPFEDKP